MTKEGKLLSQVNEATAAAIINSQSSIARLEEELKRAKVSPARIQIEVAAARLRELETKDQTLKGVKRLKNKIALNEARIQVLDFLSASFGQWTYRDNFLFATEAQVDEFKKLMLEVEKGEAAFAKLQ